MEALKLSGTAFVSAAKDEVGITAPRQTITDATRLRILVFMPRDPRPLTLFIIGLATRSAGRAHLPTTMHSTL